MATRLALAPGTNRDRDLAATVELGSATDAQATDLGRSHEKNEGMMLSAA
jgi:hypothetical protein